MSNTFGTRYVVHFASRAYAVGITGFELFHRIWFEQSNSVKFVSQCDPFEIQNINSIMRSTSLYLQLLLSSSPSSLSQHSS
jgi:hypothetical protein